MSTTPASSLASIWLGRASGELSRQAAIWLSGLLQNKQLLRRMFFVVAMSVVVFGSIALAQSGVDPLGNTTGAVTMNGTDPTIVAVPVKAMDTAQLVNVLAKAVDQALDSLAGSSTLAGIGKVLVGFGVLSMMLWSGIKILASGRGLSELIADWVPTFIALAIVTALMDSGAQKQIIAFMNSIGEAIAGKPISSTSAVITGAANSMMSAIGSVLEMPSLNSPSLADVLTGGVMTIIADLIIVGAMKILTAFLIVLAGCFYMATAIMAQASLALILALAPVMVPFLIFSPMDWVFHSWLKFMIGACMMKIVGAFMMKLTDGMMAQLGSVASLIKADSAGGGFDQLANDFVLYAFLVLLAAMSALLMTQVPTIANGVLSGHANGGGFQGFKGVTQSSGGRMGSAAASGLGAGAYQRSVGQMTARMAGNRDAANGLPNMGKNSYSNASQLKAYTRGHMSGKAQATPAPTAAAKT